MFIKELVIFLHCTLSFSSHICECVTVRREREEHKQNISYIKILHKIYTVFFGSSFNLVYS